MSFGFEPYLSYRAIPTVLRGVHDAFTTQEAWELESVAVPEKEQDSCILGGLLENIQHIDEGELNNHYDSVKTSLEELVKWYSLNENNIKKEFPNTVFTYVRRTECGGRQVKSVVCRLLEKVEWEHLRFEPPITARASAFGTLHRPEDVRISKLRSLHLINILPQIVAYLDDQRVLHSRKVANAVWILQKCDEDCLEGVIQLMDTILQESKLESLIHLIAQFREKICDATINSFIYKNEICEGRQLHFRSKVIDLANKRGWRIPDLRKLLQTDAQGEDEFDSQYGAQQGIIVESLSTDFEYKYNLIGGIHFLACNFFEEIKAQCIRRRVGCKCTSDQVQLSQQGFEYLEEEMTTLARTHQIISAGEDLSSCLGLFSLRPILEYEDIIDLEHTTLNSNIKLCFSEGAVEGSLQAASAVVSHPSILIIHPVESPSSNKRPRYIGRYVSAMLTEKAIHFEYDISTNIQRLIQAEKHEEIKQIVTKHLFAKVLHKNVLKWLLLKACIKNHMFCSPGRDREISAIVQGFATSNPVPAEIESEGEVHDVRIYFVNGNNDSGVCGEDPYRGILVHVEENKTKHPLDINAFDIEQFAVILRAILLHAINTHVQRLYRLYESEIFAQGTNTIASAEDTLKTEHLNYCCITLCWYVTDFCLKLISRYHQEHFSTLLKTPYLHGHSISDIFMMLFTLKSISSFLNNQYTQEVSQLSTTQVKEAFEFYAIARNDMPLWERVQTLPPRGPAWTIFPVLIPVQPSIQVQRLAEPPVLEELLEKSNSSSQCDFLGRYILQIILVGESVYVFSSTYNMAYIKKIEPQDMPLYQAIVGKQDAADISFPTLKCIMRHLQQLNASIQAKLIEPDQRLFTRELACPWLRSQAAPIKTFFFPLTTEMLFLRSFLLDRMHFLQRAQEMVEGPGELSIGFTLRCCRTRILRFSREEEECQLLVRHILRNVSGVHFKDLRDPIEELQGAIEKLSEPELHEIYPLERIRIFKQPLTFLPPETSSSVRPSKRRKWHG